jgi:phosphoribosylformylglycinamidine (FGAM) synthase PurS component
MPSQYDIEYAVENTQVLHEPDRRIDTFGTTRFEFQLVTELMDEINTTRIRTGQITAEKPLILRPDPESVANFDFDGFGPQGQAFGDFLKENLHRLAMLKYGFRFQMQDMQEEIVHESMGEVCDKLLAVISGVDETWEISLLKFTVEMIEKSQKINLFDFKRRGLLG